LFVNRGSRALGFKKWYLEGAREFFFNVTRPAEQLYSTHSAQGCWPLSSHCPVEFAVEFGGDVGRPVGDSF